MAGRIHRREVFNYLKKNYPEYFDKQEPQKDLEPLIRITEELAENIEA